MVRVLHKGGRVAKEASNRCFSHCTYLRSHAPPSEQLQQICKTMSRGVFTHSQRGSFCCHSHSMLLCPDTGLYNSQTTLALLISDI